MPVAGFAVSRDPALEPVGRRAADAAEAEPGLALTGADPCLAYVGIRGLCLAAGAAIATTAAATLRVDRSDPADVALIIHRTDGDVALGCGRQMEVLAGSGGAGFSQRNDKNTESTAFAKCIELAQCLYFAKTRRPPPAPIPVIRANETLGANFLSVTI